MKKLLFVFIAIFTLSIFQSCNKSNTDTGLTSESYGVQSVWCQEIDDYVNDNYPGATILEVVFASIATAIMPPRDMYLVSVEADTGSGQTTFCLIFDEDCVFLFQDTQCPE